MKTLTRILFSIALLLPFLAQAESATAINSRMVERLPAIDSLKERKVVGENNRGLLEVRGSAAIEDEQVVTDENRDRSAIYELIAKHESTSSDAVARARARQIAERSKSGLLLQAPDGAWYSKK